MLVLSRKTGEQIVIRNDITVKIVEVRNGVVRLGITAPKDVSIHREEIFERIAAKHPPPHAPEPTPSRRPPASHGAPGWFRPPTWCPIRRRARSGAACASGWKRPG